VRSATVRRETLETRVEATLGVDGTGKHDITTGIGFLDHMLTHVSLHGLIDITLKARGDLHVDAHHTAEDVALTLGQALDQALGDRLGIARMGWAIVPMDDALAMVAVDLSGRGVAVTEAVFAGSQLGDLPTVLVPHIIDSFARAARANVHARVLAGCDDHHKAEALFKALGRALDQALRADPRRSGTVPSTKGTL
jgi:imidazoleglycerol-phosphate dehydratase